MCRHAVCGKGPEPGNMNVRHIYLIYIRNVCIYQTPNIGFVTSWNGRGGVIVKVESERKRHCAWEYMVMDSKCTIYFTRILICLTPYRCDGHATSSVANG